MHALTPDGENPAMSHNPYAPPTAEVDDGGGARGAPLFFAVSPLKLLVMSTVTFGLYEVYWCYRNWALVRLRERSNIMPVMRAIFAMFFVYALFRRVREAGLEAQPKAPLPAGLLATAWIVLTLCARMPDPYWLVAMLSPLALLPVQRQVASIHAAAVPDAPLNDRFSVLNWVAVAFGVLLLAVALLGTFGPDAWLEPGAMTRPG